jgi:H+-transporting ATPase
VSCNNFLCHKIFNNTFVFQAHELHPHGLTSAEAAEAFAKYGPNELPDKKRSKFVMFISYLWGPMPIAIWVAVIIEVIRAGIAKEDFEGFIVLLILQFANAIVGYLEESKAGDAIAALRSSLAPTCRVRRDGELKVMKARELVPGDLIELILGDIIAADGIVVGPTIQVCKRPLFTSSVLRHLLCVCVCV